MQKQQHTNPWIAKKDASKVCKLFQFFVLKNVSAERNLIATDVDSKFILPKYNYTEKLMDDTTISVVDFMSRFETFKEDLISIQEAVDDLVFNANDNFKETN